MIIRISTEGQYELGEGDIPALNELDNAAVAACNAQDEQAFHETYMRLLEFVRAKGEAVADDHLGGSDLILPPPDVTLDEAKTEFSGEGLLPN
ncbi:MAG: PspA-associated protein PspAA [Solirubrobacteraceae bacterium]